MTALRAQWEAYLRSQIQRAEGRLAQRKRWSIPQGLFVVATDVGGKKVWKQKHLGKRDLKFLAQLPSTASVKIKESEVSQIRTGSGALPVRQELDQLVALEEWEQVARRESGRRATSEVQNEWLVRAASGAQSYRSVRVLYQEDPERVEARTRRAVNNILGSESMKLRDLRGGDVLYIGQNLFVVVNPELQSIPTQANERTVSRESHLTLRLAKLELLPASGYDLPPMGYGSIGMTFVRLNSSVSRQPQGQLTVSLDGLSQSVAPEHILNAQSVGLDLDRQVWFKAGRVVKGQGGIGFDGVVRANRVDLLPFRAWRLVDKPFGRKEK